jgi:hypothetical protein
MQVSVDLLINLYEYHPIIISSFSNLVWLLNILSLILLCLNLGLQDIISSVALAKILRANAVEGR